MHRGRPADARQQSVSTGVAWRVGDKTGNNGEDAAGDIAVTWSTRGEPVLICAHTQGGAPTPHQIEAVFAGIGRFVGMHFSSAV